MAAAGGDRGRRQNPVPSSSSERIARQQAKLTRDLQSAAEMAAGAVGGFAGHAALESAMEEVLYLRQRDQQLMDQVTALVKTQRVMAETYQAAQAAADRREAEYKEAAAASEARAVAAEAAAAASRRREASMRKQLKSQAKTIAALKVQRNEARKGAAQPQCQE
ncbi:hypothetical protein COHA_006269 [Chlorella ohadii]|uniref:Uncharacterized protein n=1 Tax=Chlorella ohadii TaxID=2649997 RepID=A0AAD5H0X8_9CHLO|nr:hypothetical protein COHA_006269 [Chlorella ohadii]